jgi:hypothetical protein
VVAVLRMRKTKEILVSVVYLIDVLYNRIGACHESYKGKTMCSLFVQLTLYII